MLIFRSAVKLQTYYANATDESDQKDRNNRRTKKKPKNSKRIVINQSTVAVISVGGGFTVVGIIAISVPRSKNKYVNKRDQTDPIPELERKKKNNSKKKGRVEYKKSSLDKDTQFPEIDDDQVITGNPTILDVLSESDEDSIAELKSNQVSNDSIQGHNNRDAHSVEGTRTNTQSDSDDLRFSVGNVRAGTPSDLDDSFSIPSPRTRTPDLPVPNEHTKPLGPKSETEPNPRPHSASALVKRAMTHQAVTNENTKPSTDKTDKSAVSPKKKRRPKSLNSVKGKVEVQTEDYLSSPRECWLAPEGGYFTDRRSIKDVKYIDRKYHSEQWNDNRKPY